MNLENKDDWLTLRGALQDSNTRVLIGVIQLAINEIAKRTNDEGDVRFR